ncbi:MAG TPA: hypothetical protein ENK46_05620 [Flavobacteriia bacterium]|nr:hypothetical protein [Flavobacteriia bacterium]
MKNKNIIISEGQRPIWQMVIAAFFYTIGIALLILLFIGVMRFDFMRIIKPGLGVLKISFIAFAMGYGFSVVKAVLFNLENHTYKNEYSVGSIRFGKWRPLPEIKYVSFFKQPLKNEDYIFEINLWYKKNKHFNVYRNDDYEPTLEMGFYIADKLNVRLLDATTPNKYKYLDMDTLKEKYKLED